MKQTTDTTTGKRNTIANVLLAMLLLLASCNFNFPEEINEQAFATDSEVHFDTGTQGGALQLNLPGGGNGHFEIVVFPQWMDVRVPEGQMNAGSCFIPFDFKNVEDFMADGRAEGYVIVRLGDSGLYHLTVSYGISKEVQPPVEGQEPLYCSTAEIDFRNENNRSFTIANYGNADKYWYVNNIPEWLELSESSGTLYGGETKYINCTINRSGLAPGSYSQIIHIESNNPQLSTGILIKMEISNTGGPVNSASIQWFDGELKDAYYCKTSDVMYILTKSPAKLLMKTAESDTLKAFDLERIPNCIDVSADGKTLVIGYNQAYVDVWNAETMEREQLIETDCIPFDIALGENGWCYLAPEQDQHVRFYSLNLETGVTYRTSSYSSIYEKSFLLKKPGEELIYITRPMLSPTGLLIANIENGAANDTLPYWHHTVGNRFWFTKDGSKILGGSKEIYRTPDYTTSYDNGQQLSVVGTIDIPRNNIQSLDYNENRSCYYVVGSDYTWAAENAETIYKVDEVSFEAIRSFKVGPYPGYLQNQSNPAMQVHYVFSDLQGTKLYAIKNVDRDFEMNKWAVETFSLPLN